MVRRSILIGVVLIACKSESTKPPPPAAAPVAGSADPSKAPAPAAAPVEPPPPAAAPVEPPPAPAAAPHAGSNGPKDRPLAAMGKSEADQVERAIAPYSEQARKSYPDAKKRFLAGLPAGDKFAVATKLHSPGRVETVFVIVKRIDGSKITGKIDSEVRMVTGYKAGDSYTLPETDLVDWVIVHPDGSEEGNLVGKFLDTWRSPQHP